jgi:hypothetical protein
MASEREFACRWGSRTYLWGKPARQHMATMSAG